LAQIEQEQGRRIVQVFSVGDLGLFLREEEWSFFTGPAKHKHSEWSPAIREAWNLWHWPLAIIGGNHESWHNLRVFDPGNYGGRLTYTNGRVLLHNLSGLIVVGLSGIRREPTEQRSDREASDLGCRPAAPLSHRAHCWRAYLLNPCRLFMFAQKL
jgi:hypothetical protein